MRASRVKSDSSVVYLTLVTTAVLKGVRASRIKWGVRARHVKGVYVCQPWQPSLRGVRASSVKGRFVSRSHTSLKMMACLRVRRSETSLRNVRTRFLKWPGRNILLDHKVSHLVVACCPADELARVAR